MARPPFNREALRTQRRCQRCCKRRRDGGTLRIPSPRACVLCEAPLGGFDGAGYVHRTVAEAYALAGLVGVTGLVVDAEHDIAELGGLSMYALRVRLIEYWARSEHALLAEHTPEEIRTARQLLHLVARGEKRHGR